jgi:hypothetical protein
MGTVTYPDIHVRLTGTDGNAFAIIGAVSRALRRAGHVQAAEEFPVRAMECESYDELILLAMTTVKVS